MCLLLLEWDEAPSLKMLSLRPGASSWGSLRLSEQTMKGAAQQARSCVCCSSEVCLDPSESQKHTSTLRDKSKKAKLGFWSISVNLDFNKAIKRRVPFTYWILIWKKGSSLIYYPLKKRKNFKIIIFLYHTHKNRHFNIRIIHVLNDISVSSHRRWITVISICIYTPVKYITYIIYSHKYFLTVLVKKR